MSKRSRQRKSRRVCSQQRREQAGLQRDLRLAEETVGSIVARLHFGQSELPTIPPPIEATTLPQNVIIPVAPTPFPVAQQSSWPECPANCDPLEWQRAMANHDHYLAEATKSGKPWFQHPRHPYQYSEFVYITPDMAQMLMKYNMIGTNIKNRRVTKSSVSGIERDIQNHRWLQTHESIAINKLGNMHDGQHRALGIIQAECGWPIYCTWNVPPEAAFVTDSGNKRAIHEKIGFLYPDLKLTSSVAALCRSMMWGLSNRGIKYTESEVVCFMTQHKEVVQWAATRMRPYRADMQAVIGKALLWWGEEAISPFVNRLVAVQFAGEGDPAKALYLWMQSARQQGRKAAYVGPVIYYKKALAAIHAFVAGRETKRIIAKEQDIFEWLPGWQVPTSAPCGGKVLLNQ